jgi:tetrahydromethanopterin S-methyltransferase subunit E
MSVRVSPISKTASILIIAIGVFVLYAGIVTDTLASDITGIAFIALGVILYFILIWFTKKLEREIREAERAQDTGA